MSEYNLLLTLITIAAVMGGIQGLCAYLVLLERKVCAFMQDRIGPNRVGGKLALLQPLADGLKFLFKEEPLPSQADRFLFYLAPAISLGTATLAFAVVPFGPTDPNDPGYQFIIAPRLDIGIVFTFAVASLAVYGIILGGWASNNKYSFIGALRSSAQIVSYEIPLGLSILGVVLISRSLNLERVIDHQLTGGWNIFFQPLAFVIFCTSSFAECNRMPFDLPETEQELVGGYHTEYTAMKLAMFLLGEYTHMITTSFLMVILFFGGWHIPFIADRDSFWLLKFIAFIVKMLLFILFFMLIRWTIPRFRFDQLMALAWKVLIPLALVNLVGVMVAMEYRLSLWWLLPFSVAVLVGAGVVALLMPHKRPLAA